MLWGGRVGSWMKSIFLLPYSDPARNYSLNFKDQKEGESFEEKKADTSIQETGAIHVSSSSRNKEICANALNILPAEESFYTKRTIPTNVKKWKVIPAHSRDGGSLAIAVSEMVTRMMRPLRPRWTRTWRVSALGHNQVDTAECICKTWSTTVLRQVSGLYLVHEGTSKARTEYCEDSTKSLAYFRAIQGHSGGMTIDLSWWGMFEFRTVWKEYVLSQSLFF